MYPKYLAAHLSVADSQKEESLQTSSREYIDFSAPRLARYMHRAWKRHQDAVFWVDIDLGIINEGLKFYQTRSNAIILQGALPANCIVRVERLKTGEMLYERRYLSPRPPPKISLKHDTIGPKEMIRVLQLNINQFENSFKSHLEKHFLVLPSQPNSLNPLKIERCNLSPKRLLESCKENLVLMIERGNLRKRKKNAS